MYKSVLNILWHFSATVFAVILSYTQSFICPFYLLDRIFVHGKRYALDGKNCNENSNRTSLPVMVSAWTSRLWKKRIWQWLYFVHDVAQYSCYSIHICGYSARIHTYSDFRAFISVTRLYAFYIRTNNIDFNSISLSLSLVERQRFNLLCILNTKALHDT